MKIGIALELNVKNLNLTKKQIWPTRFYARIFLENKQFHQFWK